MSSARAMRVSRRFQIETDSPGADIRLTALDASGPGTSGGTGAKSSDPAARRRPVMTSPVARISAPSSMRWSTPAACTSSNRYVACPRPTLMAVTCTSAGPATGRDK